MPKSELRRPPSLEPSQPSHQPEQPEPQPDDYLGLAEAAALVPSPRPGKRTNVATLMRWILAEKLPAVKRGPYWFVRRQDLKDLMQPVRIVKNRPVCLSAQAIRAEFQAREQLRKLGFKIPTQEEEANNRRQLKERMQQR